MIAWDGVAFPVPGDWELSGYETRAHGASLTLEDDADVRLEIEWATPGSRRDVDRIEKQHASLGKRLEAAADRVELLAGFPPGWIVYSYVLPGSKRLLTALQVPGALPRVVFAKIHGGGDSRGELVRVARDLAAGLRVTPDEAPTIWRVYDLAVRVPAGFRLRGTSFLAGRKHMLFERRGRRLLIWRLSLASQMLAGDRPAGVVARFLNGWKGLNAVRFLAVDDRVVARRKRLHILGTGDEIAYWCFRYYVRFEWDREDDSIAVMVFRYRRAPDLDWLHAVNLHLHDG